MTSAKRIPLTVNAIASRSARVIACGSDAPAGPFAPACGCHARPLPPGVPLLSATELDERPQRARVLRRRVSPVLSTQSLRQLLGPYELGPRREPRPHPLAPPAGRHCRERRRGHLLGERRRRPAQHQRTVPARQAVPDRGLYRTHRAAPAPEPRLQPRPRPHLDQVQGQPGPRPRHGSSGTPPPGAGSWSPPCRAKRRCACLPPPA